MTVTEPCSLGTPAAPAMPPGSSARTHPVTFSMARCRSESPGQPLFRGRGQRLLPRWDQWQSDTRKECGTRRGASATTCGNLACDRSPRDHYQPATCWVSVQDTPTFGKLASAPLCLRGLLSAAVCSSSQCLFGLPEVTRWSSMLSYEQLQWWGGSSGSAAVCGSPAAHQGVSSGGRRHPCVWVEAQRGLTTSSAGTRGVDTHSHAGSRPLGRVRGALEAASSSSSSHCPTPALVPLPRCAPHTSHCKLRACLRTEAGSPTKLG